MILIDSRELFEQYYQNAYDFNTASLAAADIVEIKKLVREKRTDYHLAPIGVGVFQWILKDAPDIRYELVPFVSEAIDGLLYIPTNGRERGYIILNANKPLVHQIFAALHEYYHYMKDYRRFQGGPDLCDFRLLKSVNEQKACRFAAEFLLPEEALAREVRDCCRLTKAASVKDMDISRFVSLVIILAMKYQMPPKAVIYRLVEEHYIEDAGVYMNNYTFIKKMIQKIKIFGKQAETLYSTENPYVLPYSGTYQDMESAFAAGNASRETILEDAAKLGLQMEIVCDFLTEEDETEDEEDDEALFSLIRAKRG